VTRQECLEAALKAVTDRGEAYAKPEDSFQTIADLWTVILRGRGLLLPGVDIWPQDVALMMAALKMARLISKPNHQDSWTDLAGYAACGAEITTEG